MAELGFRPGTDFNAWAIRNRKSLFLSIKSHIKNWKTLNSLLLQDSENVNLPDVKEKRILILISLSLFSFWTWHSGQFSFSVMSNSLWPHGLQHQASLSITNSQSLLKLMSIKLVMRSNHLILGCPLLLPSIFPSIRVFSNESVLCICGQSVGVSASASASVLPMNIQDWSPLGWTGWISLLPKWFSKVVSNSTVQKHQFFSTQLSLYANSHIHTWLLEKPKLWLDGPLSAK